MSSTQLGPGTVPGRRNISQSPRAVAAADPTHTTGVLIGTVAYLAPEQVERGISDARSDVYAVGVSPDGNLVAAGGEEGVVRLYKNRAGTPFKSLLPPDAAPKEEPKKETKKK